MLEKEKYLFTYLIIGSLISLCSSYANFTPGLVNPCSKWNASSRQIIYGNGTTNNDSLSLNLMYSGLDINGQTGEIAVLDDVNHRVLVFNRSNTSTLLAILSDSSNSTNTTGISFSPSAIVYDENNRMYVLDNWNKQIVTMQNPLQYGDNGTLTNMSMPSLYNGTLRGLCVDNTDGSIFISDNSQNRIIRYNINTSNFSTYAGNGTGGSRSNLLQNPTSIVMNNNRTLFVNPFNSSQIQMFPFNSTNGTTLPINIGYPINGLSVYSSDILVITTTTFVYLFNITNSQTTCAIGCDNSTPLNNTHNAVIDADGSLIITDSNQVFSYPMYQGCIDARTTTTIQSNGSQSFVPNNNCIAGTFGIGCSSIQSICKMNQPCLNSGTCIDNSTNSQGYNCTCVWGFQGNNCQDDQRPCKPFTCFQRGSCVNTSLTDFTCNCTPGYEGKQCEWMTNFCANVTCQNHGVCSRQLLNFTCKCLAGFSGRHCEITSTSTIVRTYVSRSFAYIAILMVVVLFGFVFVMDALKYVFGIDPVQADRHALQEERRKKKKKKKKAIERRKLAYRYQYVN